MFKKVISAHMSKSPVTQKHNLGRGGRGNKLATKLPTRLGDNLMWDCFQQDKCDDWSSDNMVFMLMVPHFILQSSGNGNLAYEKQTKWSILSFNPHIVWNDVNPLVFVSASYKHRTGKIKQQEVCDRTALFGVRFDVSSHSLYGCFCSCFCFEIV